MISIAGESVLPRDGSVPGSMVRVVPDRDFRGGVNGTPKRWNGTHTGAGGVDRTTASRW